MHEGNLIIRPIRYRSFGFYVALATFLYAICAGFRDNYGILLPYLVIKNDLSYASVSFIIGSGQLFFGAMQPVFGYIAARKTARVAICLGVFLMLAGLLPIPWISSFSGLWASLGFLLPSGTASASFGILMMCLAAKKQKGNLQLAGGIVGGGIGMGICLFIPLIQFSIASFGLKVALPLMGIFVALLFPAALGLTDGIIKEENRKFHLSFMEILRLGVAKRAYLFIVFVFCTCGFHMALIQTHLFSQLTFLGLEAGVAAWALSVYGLGVIGGSILSGAAGARYPMSLVLGVICASRILLIWLIFLPMPVYALFFLVFLFGLTGVAGLPPTAGIINKLFGSVIMPTLFGMAYLLHQVGAFASAWLGGVSYEITQSYATIWIMDNILCAAASLACLLVWKRNKFL